MYFKNFLDNASTLPQSQPGSSNSQVKAVKKFSS